MNFESPQNQGKPGSPLKSPPSLGAEAPPSNTEDSERLDILLADYVATREDDRSVASIQTAMFGVAVAITAAIVALSTETCQFQASAGCKTVPNVLLAAAPAAPLAMLAYMQSVGSVATLRHFYLRALEREIHTYESRSLISLPGVPAASFNGFQVGLFSLRRGRAGHRLMASAIVMAIFAIFVGLTAYLASKVDRFTTIGMAVVYGAATIAVLLESHVSRSRGRAMVADAVEHYSPDGDLRDEKRANLFRRLSIGSPGVSDNDRSLGGYLLLPRPLDVIKWLWIPLAYAIAAIAPLVPDRPSADLDQVIVVTLIVEYLVYSARYQWNDLRNLHSDSLSVTAAQRARLPIGSTVRSAQSAVVASSSVAFLRVGLAIAIGIEMAGRESTIVLAATAAVFLIAVPYELLRSRNKSSTPLTTWSLLTWVGFGYGLRVAIGCTLAGFALVDVELWIAAVAFVLVGSMSVSMTWLLEGAGASDPPSGHPRETVDLQVSDRFAEKPHILYLLSQLGFKEVRVDPNLTLTESGLHWRALQHRTRISAWWNLTFLAASGSTFALGIALSGGEHSVQSETITLLAAATVFSSTFLAVGRNLKLCWFACALPAIAFASTGMNLATCLPWIFTAVTYLFFRGVTYEEINVSIFAQVRAAAGGAMRWLRKAVFGASTVELVWPARDPRDGGDP